MKNTECCNHDCNQGRNCPLRKRPGVHQIQHAALLPEIKDMLSAPQTLNNNDRAFWVLGWNECRDAAKPLIARIAELEAQLAAAPQAVQDAVPATNHSGTPNSSTIIVPHGWKLVPDDATPEWVANLEALPDWREAVGECIKRFLAAAPAHPAEGEVQ